MKIGPVDSLKALAVINVILIHTVPQNLTTTNILWGLYVIQAMPVFFVILGLNMSLSFKNKGLTSLKDMYSRGYFEKKFWRIVFPFVIIFALSFLAYFVESMVGKEELPLKLTWLFLIGRLPVFGYGNYFVTIMFQFIFLFPLIYWLSMKSEKLMLVACFGLDLTFQLYASSTQSLSASSYLYKACILRTLSAISLGVWLSRNTDVLSNRNVLLFPISAVSIIFIMGVYKAPFLWPRENLITYPFGALLVGLGIKYFPKNLPHVQKIGDMSYHIYLIQILFFVHIHRHLLYTLALPLTALIVINPIICIILGFLFFKIEPKLRAIIARGERNILKIQTIN